MRNGTSPQRRKILRGMLFYFVKGLLSELNISVRSCDISFLTHPCFRRRSLRTLSLQRRSSAALDALAPRLHGPLHDSKHFFGSASVAIFAASATLVALAAFAMAISFRNIACFQAA